MRYGSSSITSFNPRAREGATVAIFHAFGGYFVSIHAPVKARPCLLYRLLPGLLGFNPRAREGAT